eukprot:CAMPEP_0181399788 /NCGR_PEP_ID=MMETSP1110-20121109/1781_1 /TAXON_ID=174948 /ORGANISM="Symbiodinium sp., Strain CCMP421" /LENGTH=66 /DNA_ID=CAMNT_0023521869 /DNA_START=37 /DNA_END=237 /DNA_ORIENTATION=+
MPNASDTHTHMAGTFGVPSHQLTWNEWPPSVRLHVCGGGGGYPETLQAPGDVAKCRGNPWQPSGRL